MAIMTKPDQILKIIILPIFVSVVNSKCSYILTLTLRTGLNLTWTKHSLSIRIFPTSPIGMIPPRILDGIAPYCLAFFCTKVFLTFWSALFFSRAIHEFIADCTLYKTSVPLGYTTAFTWTIFSITNLLMTHLYIWGRFANETVEIGHSSIITTPVNGSNVGVL